MSDTHPRTEKSGRRFLSGRFWGLLAVLALAGFLLWSTLASQHVECSVVVSFAGAQANGTASAANEADALREAQTTACGPLTQSMNDRIACSRIPPVTHRCRTL
jgi:hypothetical protein